MDALIRERDIRQLSAGGKRSVYVHYESIAVTDDLEGETILLLDDITTSGNSLRACRNIIMARTKAKRCVMMALARTQRMGKTYDCQEEYGDGEYLRLGFIRIGEVSMPGYEWYRTGMIRAAN